MLAFLQYLIAFLLARHGIEPGGGTTDLWGMGALGAVYWAGALWVVFRSPPPVEDPDPGRTVLLRFVTTFLPVASLVVFHEMAQNFGGRYLPDSLGLTGTVLLPDVIRMAPFLALTLANRVAVAGMARSFGHVWPGVGRLVREEAIGAVLPLGPLLAVITAYDILSLVDPLSPTGLALGVAFASPVLQVALALTVVALALLAAPFAARLAVRARPLPPGPLRERLDAYAARIGFVARDILIWHDREAINAAVIGALPRFRYVMISQGLLDTLAPDEVEAVYAHEAGHARRGHILLFFGFSAVLPLALLIPGILPGPFTAAFGALDPLLRMIVVLLVWFGVVFGWISRRFEQEADVHGIETLGPAVAEPGEQHPFARALERIAAEAGGIREVTGWRHFSIADRVAFVEAYLADESVRNAYRRSIRTLRLTLLGILGTFAMLTVVAIPQEVAQARARYRQLEQPHARLLSALAALETAPDRSSRARLLEWAARSAAEIQRHDDALRWSREAVASDPENPSARALYARELARSGRSIGAAAARAPR
jgi:STE24 endopeptidase